jgi:chemotaxis protein CheZ
VQHKVFRIEQTFAARRVAAEAHRASEEHGVSADTSLKAELTAIQDIIAGHKRALAELLGDGQERRMARAAGELGAAVDSMDQATQTILKSAESVDDNARALAAALKTDYERSLAQDIQERVVQIYEACNFQDIAGQRIGKVIAMLATLEEQLAAMLTGCDGLGLSLAATAKPAPQRGLINGPKLDGDGGHADQRDIDKMFA